MVEIKIIELPPERWQEYKNLRLEMLLKDPQAFGQSYEKSINDPDSKWKDRLEASFKQDKIIMLFAQYDGKVIGTIGAYFNFDKETENIARVFSLYVDKNFRGKGIAKKLQRQLLERLKRVKGLKKVKVQVNKMQDAAFNLYKEGGFKEVKIEKMILGDGKEYEVATMEQNLHPPHPDPLP